MREIVLLGTCRRGCLLAGHGRLGIKGSLMNDSFASDAIATGQTTSLELAEVNRIAVADGVQ